MIRMASLIVLSVTAKKFPLNKVLREARSERMLPPNLKMATLLILLPTLIISDDDDLWFFILGYSARSLSSLNIQIIESKSLSDFVFVFVCRMTKSRANHRPRHQEEDNSAAAKKRRNNRRKNHKPTTRRMLVETSDEIFGFLPSDDVVREKNKKTPSGEKQSRPRYVHKIQFSSIKKTKSCLKQNSAIGTPGGAGRSARRISFSSPQFVTPPAATTTAAGHYYSRISPVRRKPKRSFLSLVMVSPCVTKKEGPHRLQQGLPALSSSSSPADEPKKRSKLSVLVRAERERDVKIRRHRCRERREKHSEL